MFPKIKRLVLAALHIKNRNVVSVNWVPVILSHVDSSIDYTEIISFCVTVVCSKRHCLALWPLVVLGSDQSGVSLSTAELPFFLWKCMERGQIWHLLWHLLVTERYDLLLQATWSLRFFYLIRCCLCGKLYSDFVGEMREAHSEQKELWVIREVHHGSSCSMLVKFKMWRNAACRQTWWGNVSDSFTVIWVRLEPTLHSHSCYVASN